MVLKASKKYKKQKKNCCKIFFWKLFLLWKMSKNYFKQGNELRKKEDWEGAFKAYAKACKEEPENSKILLCIGFVSHKLKKYPQSEKAYKKVLELEKREINALKGLIKLYQDTEENSKLLDTYIEMSEAVR